MALIYADRVQEVTSTAGTGAYTLAGAAQGFQSFAVVGDGNTCYYAVTDGTDWEVGLGTYAASGPTLARTAVSASSNSNAAVNWTGGVKNIWLDFPALVASYLAGGVTGTGAVVRATSPTLTTPNLGTPSAVTLSNGTGLPLTTGVTGTLPIANGGTNATSAAAALANLGGVAGPGSATDSDLVAFDTTTGKLIKDSGTLMPRTAGSGNFGFGPGALTSRTTGNFNTAFGAAALQTNAITHNNTAFGYAALNKVVAGDGSDVGGNVAFGGGALGNTTSGFYCLGVGVNAGGNNTTGLETFAIGFTALGNNTTGSFNVAVGNAALLASVADTQNVGVGHHAFYLLNGGSYNTAIGNLAGDALTTGSNNVFVGYNNDGGITTGSGNTLLGANIGGLSGSQSNAIVLASGGTIRADYNVTNAGKWTFASNIVTPGTVTIASGSFPASATVDVTNIPGYYSKIVVQITGVSFDTASRAFQVRCSTDNGSTFDSTAGNYQGFTTNGSTTLALKNTATLGSQFLQNAADTSIHTIEFSNQAGPDKIWQSSSTYTGVAEYVAWGRYKSASLVNAIRFQLDGSGNFDAGTYAVYGVP